MSPPTYFVHGDHLGSTRLPTNYPTPTVAGPDDYYPFAESNSLRIATQRFTGDERDSESSLDHTLLRQYSPTALSQQMFAEKQASTGSHSEGNKKNETILSTR